ncbi:ribulose-phosphate 3-epimerase [Longirhabdus pacifica]|uniref:ribulose-phosphate 3-epimerase n=1 Tax=Longirhabdus pacifica TaxID=2305227 RepID=UPI001008C13D|nr:ribulose-phosphate 3-epimerase [Longirhabdus pacifica]
MMKIAPSILSADFAKLGEEIKEVETAGADWLHVDIMDGHFVPNISIGPMIIEAIKPHTELPLDVHLMISNPDAYIPTVAKAGADLITVHAEASVHLHRTVQLIKDHGKKAGIAFNPATPIQAIEPMINEVDLILVMTINPGFGGQKLIDFTVDKVKAVHDLVQQKANHPVHIEVDGGVNVDTIDSLAQAGADVLVAGSAIFNQKDRKQAILDLREAVTK